MATQTRSSISLPVQERSHNLWLYAGVVFVAAAIAFFMLYRLESYPAPWTDESSYLQIAKNYAINGIYGEISSEGPRFSGGVIGTGPTVILPVTLLYKVMGVSIPAARLLIVATGLACLVMLYLTATKVVNNRIAIFATAIMFLSPAVAFVHLSRTVIGEVPGLLFVLAAFWLWFRTDKPRTIDLVTVGMLFGLACITKNQYALFILPSLLVCWFADMFYYRQHKWQYFVIPGAIAGALFFGWTYYVLFMLGSAERSIGGGLSTVSSTGAAAFFVIKQETIQRAIRLLLNSNLYAGFTVPVLFYGLLLCRPRTLEGQRWGVLYIFVFIALFEFVFSLAWARYAFVPMVLISIFVARLFADLTNGLQFDWKRARGLFQGDEIKLSTAANVVVVGLMVLLLAWPFINLTHDVSGLGNSNAYRTADYIKANVPADALVETWELELAVLTDHNYHFPPQDAMTALVAFENLGGKPVGEMYNFLANGNPDYVVVGPFGKRSEIYNAEDLAAYDRIYRFGDYDIYQLRANMPPAP